MTGRASELELRTNTPIYLDPTNPYDAYKGGDIGEGLGVALGYALNDNGRTVIMMDDVSFKSIIILAGKGIMEDSSNSFEFNQGDSFFAPAGNNKIKIIGMCTVLVTHI